LNEFANFLFAHPTAIQVSLFACIIVSLWVAESLSQQQSLAVKWRHTSLNSVFILTALPIQIAMTLLCLGVSRWVTQNQWGLLNLLPNADDPLIKYGLMFVVLDLLDYVYHRTMHHFPFFWRFHLYHHTDQAVDVTTTVREHPGESFIRNCFLILWVFICGASPEILVLRQTTQTMANLSSHSTLRLPRRSARVFAWLFITPNLHHAHHHFMLPTTNRNYGDVLSIWDRLFGTLVHYSREETVFGLQTHMDGSVDARLAAILNRGQALLGKILPRVRAAA
jgi:sterol desaturase/sphingolipid hydroxylase (fatty acid hydroxylase superfamily)